MMPSHFRILEMVLLGRTLRSSGIITVGPVTQTNAPNSSAIKGSMSNNRYVDSATMAMVITTPTDTSICTTVPCCLISSNSKVSDPSNKMMATPKEIKGNISSPKTKSGSNIPSIGPTIMPINNKNRMDGCFKYQANHWAAMPSPTTPDSNRAVSINQSFYKLVILHIL